MKVSVHPPCVKSRSAPKMMKSVEAYRGMGTLSPVCIQ